MTAELRFWRKIRRLAVPPWMIERATERRLAGDWRGACAAADIDVDLDLGAISRTAGSAVAERVRDDLSHLVPDLLRWHLPRALPGTLLVRAAVPLTRYEVGGLQVMPRYPDSESQRLVLRFAEVNPDQVSASLHASPERWDSRRTADLFPRVPFFGPDGRPLPPADFGPDEELVRLQDAGEWTAAWKLAGFDLSAFEQTGTPAYGGHVTGNRLRAGRYDLARLPAVIRETARPGGHPAALIDVGRNLAVRIDSRTLTVEPRGHRSAGEDDRLPFVPAARAERPVDYDLVRLGHLPVDALHPLVAAALFPARPPVPGPPAFVPELETVRVRCHGAWHPVTMAGGALGIPHPPEEVLREQALHALGGTPLTGCYAATLGWRDPAVRLAKALRLRRQEVMLRALHGDGTAINAWLAAGLDPHLRDHRGRTLLHMLSWLRDWQEPLPALVAAGLDLEARDNDGYPPLLHAVARGGPAGLVEALLALGTQRDAVGPAGAGWEQLAREHDRLDELRPVFSAGQ